MEQRILGMQVHHSQKMATQVEKLKKLFGALAFNGHDIMSRVWDIMYRLLVRPHLEDCAQFWSSCYRKDDIQLEKPQKGFTIISPGLKCLSYVGRLDRLP